MQVDYNKVVQRLMARNSELQYNLTVSECLIEDLLAKLKDVESDTTPVVSDLATEPEEENAYSAPV